MAWWGSLLLLEALLWLKVDASTELHVEGRLEPAPFVA